MASSTQSELEIREAEAAEARARLANTLDTLSSPETQQAVKAEVLGYVEGYKDELLKQADRYKDELLQKADEYKGEMMERAEQYKDEFLSRADEYKHEALERAEAYKDEALQRAQNAGRETMQNVVEDLKTRAMNNPVAVALIGAGVGWRLYKHPPITTLLVGAGAALLMRTPGRSEQDGRWSARDRRGGTRPLAYRPGRFAESGSPAEADASGSSPASAMMDRASDMAEQVRDAAEAAGSRIADTAARARSTMVQSSGEMLDQAGDWLGRARGNPLLLGLAGLAAGAAVARTVRATETGDRLVRESADVLGRGAREVTSRIGDAAGQAVESAGSVASAAASTMSGMADTVRDRVPEAASGVAEAANRALEAVGYRGRSSANRSAAPARGPARRRRTGRGPGPMEQARSDIMQAVERYPLVFGSLALIVAAAAGAALRPTAAEDRYVGRASDSLKRRAQQQMAGQLDRVLHAADEVMSSVEHRLGEAGAAAASGDAERSTSREDLDKTAVVVERAEDAAAAEASVTKKPA